MTHLKTYTLGNHGFVAGTILDALGEPGHRRQARVYIVATSKREAAELAYTYGCGRISASDPELRVDGSPFAVAILASTDIPRVYVAALDARPGDPVLAVDDAGPYRVGEVGRNGNARIFVPDES
jgi:hypothetical protein